MPVKVLVEEAEGLEDPELDGVEVVLRVKDVEGEVDSVTLKLRDWAMLCDAVD